MIFKNLILVVRFVYIMLHLIFVKNSGFGTERQNL